MTEFMQILLLNKRNLTKFRLSCFLTDGQVRYKSQSKSNDVYYAPRLR